MSSDVVRVMYYDRDNSGNKRLTKNSAMLEESFRQIGGFQVVLDRINRPARFPGESAALELLAQNGNFPYDAVMISSAAPQAEEVIVHALAKLEGIKQSAKRVIVLYEGGIPVEYVHLGATCVSAGGGNCHLNKHDADNLAKTLQHIIENQ
ncbi:hypothetical protein HYS31_06980 [Candidatus Woesearchaeota archaeon]|nr:hypothetical protein [Candidatus Woesearchaeota archaeon]